MLIKKKSASKNYFFGVVISLAALATAYGLLLRYPPSFKAEFTVDSHGSIDIFIESTSVIQPQYTLFGPSEAIAHTQLEGASRSWFPPQPTDTLAHYPPPLTASNPPRAIVAALTYPWASQVNASQAQYITFTNDSTALPVVSINAPAYYFFGEAGLYSVNKSAKQATSSYPIHFQLLDTSGDIQVSERVQSNVAGYSTKKLPMKSLNIDFEQPIASAYFFGNSSHHSLRSLRLRNAGNDFLIAYMRDAVVSSLGQSTHCITLDLQPVTVFINGEFWGLQYLRERIEEDNLVLRNPQLGNDQVILGELHQGKSLVISNGFDYEIGKLIDFVDQADFSQEANYDSLSQLVNIPNFIDYVAIQTFVSNSDWPHNNVKCAFLNGQLYFLLYDVDFAFAYPQYYREQGENYFEWPDHIYEVNALTHNYFDSLDTHLPSKVGQLYQALMQSPVFRQQFINRYRALLNTSLSSNQIRQTVNTLRDQLSPLMPHHIARWGHPASVEVWHQNVSQIIEFCNHRRPLVLKQLEALENQTSPGRLARSDY